MSMPIGAAPNQAPKKWTILYYFDGKNNLAPMAEHSFNSLDKVGSDDNVNLVAQFGMPKKPVLQGLIEKSMGAGNLADIGEQDMGSADNLKKFVEWGMKNYPAEHYALVMWDHGAGFKGSMVDDETEHIIKNHDLAAALEDVAKTTGKKMDIINWNACLMQQAEVGYELRNAASYMVGSQEVEAGLRIPIPGLFGTTPQHEVAKDIQEACKTKSNLSPEEVAKLFVFEAKNQFAGSMFTPTQSAIDLSKMGKVKDSMDQLAGALLDALNADPSNLDRVRSDIKSSQRMIAADMYLEPYVDYRDLGDFARSLVKDEKLCAASPAVAEAAKTVMSAVKDAVIAEQHAPISGFGGRSLEGATGMTAYIPRDYGHDKVGKSTIDGLPNGGTHGYENQAIAKETKWETLLKTVSKDTDWVGKMPGQRALMNFGQVANYYGYQYAWEALGGASHATWNIWPLMGFPYFLPIPGVIAAGAGAIANVMRVKKGISKIADGIKREDSPMKNRVELGVQGALDTAVGVGSIAICGAMAAGVMSPALIPVAAGVMAVGVGRLAVSLARNLYKKHKAAGMDVDQKLAAAPSGPQFSALNGWTPAAPAAKAAPQPQVAAAPQPTVAAQPAVQTAGKP
jgi:hypothetical protein